jgi:hypothetical protein
MLEVDKRRQTFQVRVSLFQLLPSLCSFLVYLVMNGSDRLAVRFRVDEVCNASNVLSVASYIRYSYSKGNIRTSPHESCREPFERLQNATNMDKWVERPRDKREGLTSRVTSALTPAYKQ